jgi:hypothetical protein
MQSSVKKNHTNKKDPAKAEDKLTARGMRSKSEEKKFSKIRAVNQANKAK